MQNPHAPSKIKVSLCGTLDIGVVYVTSLRWKKEAAGKMNASASAPSTHTARSGSTSGGGAPRVSLAEPKRAASELEFSPSNTLRRSRRLLPVPLYFRSL